MQHIILTILLIIGLSSNINTAKAYTLHNTENDPPVSGPIIIHSDDSTGGDNRDYSFPFYIQIDEQSNSLIITYDQERPADLDLSNVNGAIISHQSICGSGIFTMPLPSVSGTFYLFMTTPTILAYVTITL